ncbi:class C sortase [uncultured Ruminococcus sp.]|uniref:class C sortase n=1 Tax=uncultured Ruminococcus sp. TaxID=165186 RepID=UPI0025F6393D|nr:class C sortase [uncultured Ruminococcus sp.]
MGKVRNKIPIFIAIFLFVLSAIFLAFPTVSNALYQAENQSTITKYNRNVSSMSKAEKEKYLTLARQYNESLTETISDAFVASAYENIKPDYESVLNFNDGQICSIDIPKINVNLPVYHGSSEDVLTKGAAHSANTSFPIGGKSTHSVISAHTAYPGKVFFDDLTELEKGDIFYINVLDEKLAYKICDISIAEPDDTSKLKIVYDKDLVTLVTCYPYAVNSHRLLVTGERIENDTTDSTKDELNKPEEKSNSFSPAVFIFIGIALIIVIIIFSKIKTLKKPK